MPKNKTDIKLDSINDSTNEKNINNKEIIIDNPFEMTKFHITNQNNLHIISESNPNLKVFALVICINIGSRDEIKEINGISHLIEHLIFKRSAKKSAKQIANRFEDLGAFANAFTSKEQTVFYVRGLVENFDKILELLFEIVYNSEFIEKEIEKEKVIIIDEISSYEDDAEELIYEDAEKMIFENNTLAFPIAGEPEILKKININNILNFYKTNYVLKNTKITYIGNLNQEILYKKIINQAKINNLSDLSENNEIIDTIEVESINNNETIDKSINRQSPFDFKTINHSTEKFFTQSHILTLKPFINLNDEEKICLTIINLLFGESMSSRLSYRFREANAISYSVYSSLQVYIDTIVFYIYLAVDKNKLAKSKQLLENEINKLFQGTISSSELLRAKEQMKTSLYLENESLTDKAINMLKIDDKNYESYNLENLIEKLNSVDLKYINNFCLNQFDPKTFSQITYLEKK